MINVVDLTIAERLYSVSGEVEPGEWLALCGPNGAGKSTLMLGMAGLQDSTRWQGDVYIRGQSIKQLSLEELATVRAVYIQPTGEMLPTSVDHVLRLASEHVPLGVRQTVINDVVDGLSLEPLLFRSLDHLSSGERQRVHMARCLIQVGGSLDCCEGRILFLDEPLSSLDRAFVSRVLAWVSRFRNQGGTVVMCSHQLHHVQRWCDKVWMLRGGQVIARGTIDQVFIAPTIQRTFGCVVEPIVDQDGQAWWVT